MVRGPYFWSHSQCINHASYQIDEDVEACDACVYDPDMFSPSALRVSFASPIDSLTSSRDKVSFVVSCHVHHHCTRAVLVAMCCTRSSLLCLTVKCCLRFGWLIESRVAGLKVKSFLRGLMHVLLRFSVLPELSVPSNLIW